MAEESQEDKNKSADRTDVQPGTWNQTDLIIKKICTFLDPNDLKCFRLVCKTWNNEAYPFWAYHRMRHILTRDSLVISRFLSEYGHLPFGDYDNIQFLPEFHELTVFKKYPPRNNCDIDRVGAEELRRFFLDVPKDEVDKFKKFTIIKLRKWIRFGSFSSGELNGARWFLKEITDKVKHLTLDTCNFSISQGEFFPTLCKMSKLQQLTIRGTHFHLRPSFPIEPTLAEISPIPGLIIVEMNYEKCSKKEMPKYFFPWNLFLAMVPNMKCIDFSYTNWSNLDFAIHQFSKMMAAFKETEPEEGVPYQTTVIFMNLGKPNEDPTMPKTTVVNMVYESLMKLNIGAFGSHLLWSYRIRRSRDLPLIEAVAGNLKIIIDFQDLEMRNMRENRNEN